MNSRAHTRDAYTPGATEGAYSLALGLATALGDFTEAFVVIGGLVPSLICSRPDDDPDYEPHLGTLDVDIAFTRDLLDGKRYYEVVSRLRSIDLEPDPTPGRAPSHSRWRVRSRPELKVDFLLERGGDDEVVGRPKHLTAEFGPILIDGVHLAASSARDVVLAGTTHDGAMAERPVRVCSAGALSVLKAIAFRMRGFGKDAYDLAYVLAHAGLPMAAIAAPLRAYRDDPVVRRAVGVLETDFSTLDRLGPWRATRFLDADAPPEYAADVVAAVNGFVRALRA